MPVAAVHPWYALVELSDSLPDARLGELLKTALAEAFERDVPSDAIVASSSAQVARSGRCARGSPRPQDIERTREATRLELMLEDASIKLSSVAASLTSVSARAMLTR